MAISIPEAGELKHFISLVKRIDYPLKNHEVKQIDYLLFTCWAKIEPTGALYWSSVEVEQKATHRFWFRSVKRKTDSLSISHGVLILCDGRYFRPTRVTDANGEGVFTVVEACELGDIQPENKNLENNTSSMMAESLL